MKKMRKIIAMALAIVMMLSMVAGCGKKEPELIASDPTEAEPTVKVTAESTEATTEAEEIEYASVVFVSVNPQFAIYFDAEGKVIKVFAENDDGEALDMDLESLMGMATTDAVEALLDTIADAGYFDDGEHDIELTFYGEAEGDVEDIAALNELEKAICEAVNAYAANKEIKVKVKVSPAAAPVTMAEVKKLPAPHAPDKKPDKEEETTQPTEAPKPTEPAIKPTEAPKPTAPAPKPTEPKPTTPPATQPTEPAHQHDYKTEEVKATYETGGYTKYTCSCGHSYEGNHTAPLYDPTTPTEPTTGNEPTTPSDAKCSFCGGPHYLYECAAAREEAEKEENEPIVCAYCGTTNCDYPETGEPTRCPQYNEKNDASKYCQSCGKSTSICTQYTEDMNCPKCGTFVTKFTCHYC